MLAALIRSEAAMKDAVLGTAVTLAVSVPVLLVVSSAGLGALGQGPSGAFNERLLASMLLGAGLFPALLVGLRQMDLRGRADEFRLSLPVSLASLLSARIAALVFAGWLPLLATASVLAFFLRHPETRSFLTVRSLNAAAGWLVFVLVLHVVAVERRRLTGRELTVCILVGLFALAAAAATGTWVLGLTFFVLAGLLALRVARRLPPRLPLVEDTPVRQRPARKEAAGPAASVVRRLLLRAMVWRWTTFVFVPLCAVILAMARVTGGGAGPNLFMLAVFTTQPALQGLLETAHLPLSRRRIFTYVVGPSLLAVLIGLVGGELLVAGLGEMSESESVAFEYQPEEVGGYVMAVPVSHWRVSFDGTTPETRIGRELIQPPLYRPVASLGIGVYNPYAVNPATSAPAAAHQLSRAVREVHGGVILPEELQARYLSHSPASGRVLVDSVRLLGDYPSLRPTRDSATLRWLALGILWFLVLFPALGHAAPPATPAVRRWRIAGWTAAGVLFLPGMFVLELSSKNAVYAAGPILFLKIVLERSAALIGQALPEGPLGWLVVAIVYASAYFVHEARFRRIEVPKRLAPRWGGWGSG